MADDAATNDAAAATDDTAAAATDAAPKMLPQDEVNKIVQERLARERQKFADYDELKQAKAQLDEIKQAQMTELEKATERAAKLEREMALAAEREQRLRQDNAIVAEAAKRGIDTDVAKALADRAALEFDDSGNPTNIATVIEALAAAKPHLVQRPGAIEQGARTRDDQVSRDQITAMSDADFEKALAQGKFSVALRGGNQ